MKETQGSDAKEETIVFSGSPVRNAVNLMREQQAELQSLRDQLAAKDEKLIKAWNKGAELTEQLQYIRDQLKQREEEMRKAVHIVNEHRHRDLIEKDNEIKELKEALIEILPHAYCVHSDILDKARKLIDP